MKLLEPPAPPPRVSLDVRNTFKVAAIQSSFAVFFSTLNRNNFSAFSFQKFPLRPKYPILCTKQRGFRFSSCLQRGPERGKTQFSLEESLALAAPKLFSPNTIDAACSKLLNFSPFLRWKLASTLLDIERSIQEKRSVGSKAHSSSCRSSVWCTELVRSIAHGG